MGAERAERRPPARGPGPWLARSLRHRVTAAALALALAVALILGVTSFVAVRHLVAAQILARLENHAGLVRADLTSTLNAVARDAANLAGQSLVANALVDSVGRDAYLVPFLREHRLGGGSADVVLCDFRGRPIASSGPAADAQPVDAAAVLRVLQGGAPAAELVEVGGAVRLVLTYPVVLPPTGQPEGALVARFDLEETFERAAQAGRPGDRAVLLAGGAPRLRAGAVAMRQVALSVERPLALDPPLDALRLAVVMAADASALAPVRWVGVAYVAIGLVLLAAVSAAARAGADQLTTRLRRLAEAARRVDAGDAGAAGELPVGPEPHDEVETVAGAFNATLARLRTIQDTLEQKVQERTAANAALLEELRVSEERLRLALAAGAHAEWELDVPSARLTLGPRWWEMVGAGPDERDDTMEGWRRAVHPEDRERAWAALEACLEGRTGVYEGHYRIATRSGWRWVRSRGHVVSRDAAGRAIRMIGTRTDVTELEDLQQRLLAATRLASVGTLAAGVAHEINNPLTYVAANLDLVLDLLAAHGPGVPPEARGRLLEAREGASRIAAIVGSMRALGVPERPEEPHAVNVRDELLHAIQMVRNQLTQRAELAVSIADDLPRARARTNELGRVFLNLLVNAAQAIPEGPAAGHRISVAARREGGSVVVEVSDTGAGIAPDVRERIFDAFFTTKPVGVGTGLGLPIALSIVRAAGGAIEVDSEPGRGATFRVLLPAADDGPPASAGVGPPPTATAVPPPSAAPPALAVADARRRRVLLVDDEPLVLRSVERMLRRDHEVVGLGSATEALARMAAGERWDAIVCDLMMSGVDGAALYQAVAAEHPALLPRVAFLTGGAFGDRATRFLAEHDVPVLAKPVVRAELVALIERLARAGERAAPLSPRRG